MPILDENNKPRKTKPDVKGVQSLFERLKEKAARLNPEQKELREQLLEIASEVGKLEGDFEEASRFAEQKIEEVKRLRTTGDDTSAAIIKDLENQLAFHQENTAQRLLGVCAYLNIPMKLEQATAICRHTPKA